MKISSVILVALICGVAFSADTPTCSGYLSNTCNTTNCQFTPDANATSFCTSKCLGITSEEDCQQNTTCNYQGAKCLPKVADCQLFNKDKATCTNHNNACSFTDAICTPNDNLTNTCKALNGYAGCSANANCLFTATGTPTCVMKDGYQCNDTCSNTYCSFGTCSNPNDTCGTLKKQTDCEANTTCQWDGATCKDKCASLTDATVCKSLGCANKCNSTASTACSAITKDADCIAVADNACVSTTVGTCGPNQGACVVDTCNKDNCNLTAAQCSNPKCPDDATNCGASCFQLPATCVPKSATQCLNSIKDSSNCESQGCVFSQVGTCSTKTSNSAIIIFSLLSSLIALMF